MRGVTWGELNYGLMDSVSTVTLSHEGVAHECFFWGVFVSTRLRCGDDDVHAWAKGQGCCCATN